MITTSEGATQKSTILLRRSVHRESFLWAFCQELVCSTIRRLVAFSGAGLPFAEISAMSFRSSRRIRGSFES